MRFKRERRDWYNPGQDPIVSERLYRKRHTFAADLPTYYGGGFWERVTIGPRCCPHGAQPGPCYLCTPAAEGGPNEASQSHA